ncbi:MAG: EAL domain-containing protein [Acidithiobacillus sp.]|nr:EAL domain-containing protein [Acidithiobacillus sp.]
MSFRLGPELLTTISLPAPGAARRVGYLRLNFLLALASLLLAALNAWIFSASTNAHFWPIWLGAGVSAYGILAWGPAVIPGLFLAHCLADAVFLHLPLGINLWVNLGGMLALWLGALLLRRARPQWAGFQILPDISLYLILFALLPSLLNAAWIASGALLLTHASPPTTISHLFLYWVLAQLGGVINVGILLLLYLHGKAQGPLRLRPGFVLVAAGILCSIVLIFFHRLSPNSLTEAFVLLIILPFLWLLAHYPMQLVYPLAAISSFLALVGTSYGLGPYTEQVSLLPETMAQLVSLTLEVIGLIAGAMMAERIHATLTLHDLNQDLEKRVAAHSFSLQQQNRELQARDAFLQSVTEVNRLFASSEQQTPAETLERFCQILVKHMGLAAAWIGKADVNRNQILFQAIAGPLAEVVQGLQLHLRGPAEQALSPSGLVIQEDRTLFIDANDPLFHPWRDLIEQYNMGGSIYTPLRWPDGSSGVLTLYRFKDTDFPQEIAEMLERLSEDVSVFLRRRQTESQLKDTRILQQTMLISGDLALQAREAPSMLQEICDELIQSGLFNAVFIIRPDASGVFQALAWAGRHVDWILQRHWTIDPEDFPHGQSLTARAWREQRHLIIQDYLAAIGTDSAWREEASANQWRAAATFPIYHMEEPWAMLNLIGDRVQLFTEELVEVLQRIALLIGHGLDEIRLKADLLEERKRQSYLAQHDALTGLANRRGLTEFLEPAMARARRSGQLLAVAMLDLDDFKPVNDLYGHPAGDRLLQEVAKRLRQSLRQSDHVARLGGDEFVLAWDSIPDRQQIQNILSKIGESLSKPYFLEGLPLIRIRISAGVTIYPQNQTDSADPDLLLRQADHALYEAKQNKVTRSQFWTFFHEEESSERQRMQTLLRNGSFHLQYQPVLDQRQDRTVGVEALARLAGTDCAISPGDFLPLLSAEDQWTLTKLVLEQIARDWQAWGKAAENLWISFNIPPNFLANGAALERLEKLLENCPVPPRALILEILESDELLSLQFSAQSIQSLQALGYRVGLDDVGTGYASLLYLKELPVDEIKIDQAFVRHLGENPNDLHFLRALLDLGLSQGFEVIVEGVENQTIRNVLALMQVPLLQGYAIASPMFAEALPDWLSQQQARNREQQNGLYDLLQLYAEVIDYQKTISGLVLLSPAWFLQIDSWQASNCPIHHRLRELSFSGRELILRAHERYHTALEEIAQRLRCGQQPDLFALRATGDAVLEEISLAMGADQKMLQQAVGHGASH